MINAMQTNFSQYYKTQQLFCSNKVTKIYVKNENKQLTININKRLSSGELIQFRLYVN